VEFADLFFRPRLHTLNLIACLGLRSHHLIQLQMQRSRVPVLRVLQNEHHQQRDDRDGDVGDFDAKGIEPVTTKRPAMKTAQWLPVHLATQVEKSLKKMWIRPCSCSCAIEGSELTVGPSIPSSSHGQTSAPPSRDRVA
jgi:hypothetical protein